MSKDGPNQQRLIKISYQKPVNGGMEKREIILTGYDGLVLIILAVLATAGMLILLGTKFF